MILIPSTTQCVLLPHSILLHLCGKQYRSRGHKCLASDPICPHLGPRFSQSIKLRSFAPQSFQNCQESFKGTLVTRLLMLEPRTHQFLAERAISIQRSLLAVKLLPFTSPLLHSAAIGNGTANSLHKLLLHPQRHNIVLNQ
jgi:hypothetical protein